MRDMDIRGLGGAKGVDKIVKADASAAAEKKEANKAVQMTGVYYQGANPNATGIQHESYADQYIASLNEKYANISSVMLRNSGHTTLDPETIDTNDPNYLHDIQQLQKEDVKKLVPNFAEEG